MKKLLISLVFIALLFTVGLNRSHSQSNDPKRWVARITQSGESAPTVTVFENTLGGTVTWTRMNDGIYFGNLNGAFPQERTVILNGKQTWFDGGLSDGKSAFLLSNSAWQPDNLILVTQACDFSNPSCSESDNVLNDGNAITVEVVVYPEP